MTDQPPPTPKAIVTDAIARLEIAISERLEMTGGDAARVGVLIDDIRTVIAAANPEASEIIEALDTTPTGALGLPRWKYELRAAAACMNVDAPLSLAYRKYLAEMFGKLERAIEALSSICKGEREGG